MTIEDIKETLPEVPIVVDAHPLLVKGQVRHWGRNALVTAGKFAGTFSWDAVEEAVNDRTGYCRLSLPNHIPKIDVPKFDLSNDADWDAFKKLPWS